jgi:hypothetical protein
MTTKTHGVAANPDVTLDRLFSEVGPEAFVSRYVGQEYIRLHGDARRCEDILALSEIEAFLATARTTASRVQLIKTGSPLPAESYLKDLSSPLGARVDQARLTRELTMGATLLLVCVDEWAPGVSHICRQLEALLETPVLANVYASWAGVQGFKLHWDKHDTLILQIHGTKQWRVLTPTTRLPMPWDGNVPTPDASMLAWEGKLQTGDLLYMPRGWWHDAQPQKDMTLHVTFGFTRATTYDFLRWALDRAVGRETLLRTDISNVLGDPAWMTAVLSSLQHELTPERLAAFRRQRIAGTQQAAVKLPSLVPRGRTQIETGDSIRLNGTATIVEQDGGATLRVGNLEWRVSAAATRACRILASGGDAAVDHVLESLPHAERQPFRTLLTGLALAGVAQLYKAT